ncbi:hypothetical protein FACS189454_10100 [Planctomycetales bacterium]|nr:hypothetical protein FACS189454_10100 [Planctomycetales bacterium]
MFWDAGQIYIGGFGGNDDAHPVLIGAVVNVLENALFLSNSACQRSALHGIGHSIVDLREVREHADKKLLQKLEQAIDHYCQQPDVPPELRGYAKQAQPVTLCGLAQIAEKITTPSFLRCTSIRPVAQLNFVFRRL